MRVNMKSIISLIGIAAVCVFLGNASLVLGAEKEMIFGITGPMTGPASESGEHIRKGAVLAVENINSAGGVLGRQIKLVFGDDESKPAAAVGMTERLIINDKAELLTGTLNSDVALATMDVTGSYGIPQIFNLPVSAEITKKIVNNPSKYKYVVKNGPSPDVYRVAIPDFFKFLESKAYLKPQNKTVVFIRERTSWGIGLQETIGAGFETIGWKVAGVETVDIGQSDYLSLLSKIKSIKPDAIVLVQTSVAAATSVLKQFTQSGIQAFYMPIFIPSDPKYIELGGETANGVAWMVNIAMLPTEKGISFANEFEKRWKNKPAMASAVQYDIMNIIKSAYTKAGSTDKNKFMDALMSIRYEGTTGVYGYNPENHEVKSGPEFIPVIGTQIQNQKNTIIWPERYAKGTFIAPPWIKK